MFNESLSERLGHFDIVFCKSVEKFISVLYGHLNVSRKFCQMYMVFSSSVRKFASLSFSLPNICSKVQKILPGFWTFVQKFVSLIYAFLNVCPKNCTGSETVLYGLLKSNECHDIAFWNFKSYPMLCFVYFLFGYFF